MRDHRLNQHNWYTGDSILKEGKKFQLRYSVTDLFFSHILQDQYEAEVMSSRESHLCLALNDFSLLGLSLLISMFGSPKRTMFTFLVSGFFTQTANFLFAFGVRNGLFSFLFNIVSREILIPFHFPFFPAYTCIVQHQHRLHRIQSLHHL